MEKEFKAGKNNNYYLTKKYVEAGNLDAGLVGLSGAKDGPEAMIVGVGEARVGEFATSSDGSERDTSVYVCGTCLASVSDGRILLHAVSIHGCSGSPFFNKEKEPCLVVHGLYLRCVIDSVRGFLWSLFFLSGRML